MPGLDIRAILLVAALLLDALAGDPPWLWKRLPHPAALLGMLIGRLDHLLNREIWTQAARRAMGTVALAILVSLAVLTGVLLSTLFSLIPYGVCLEVLAAAILIAQKSLYTHVAAVAEALESESLEDARNAVAHIVGRDPETLDEPAIARAALESLAENFSDGVTAPALFYLFAGLPGLFAYKAVNTADSMIGYKTERHRAFGWAAAKTDDVLNFIPARLSALFIACAAAFTGQTAKESFKAMARDAGKHASPNAGWPETAMAGALSIALAGPRRYAGATTDDPWLNEEARKEAAQADIRKGLKLFAAACAFQLVLIAAAGAALL